MVGLVDIAPAVERVTVRGTAVEVYGISAKGIASLLMRFPELQLLMAGRSESLDSKDVIALGGDFVGALIAAGCGEPDDEKAEAAAARLSLGDQADFIEVILRVTMPRGPGPFVEQLTAIAGIVGGTVQSVTVQPTKSPKGSRRSSLGDTTPMMSGTTLPSASPAS